MSVAPECAPEVFIPERARTRRPVPSALRLVTPAGDTVEVPTALAALPVFAPVVYLPAAPVSPFAPPVRVAPRRVVTEVAVPSVTPAPLRLTRRGVAVLAAATVVLGLLLLTAAHLSLAPKSAAPASPRVVNGVVTVQSGDTLWSIAAQVAPQRDPRLEVDQLRRVNSLDNVALTPGQTLKVS